ncbi:MAG: acyltransferase family protein [Acidimicrobiales bacterium]
MAGRESTGGRSTAPRLAYQPGLDGVRAFAVLAVMAYHNGFSWAPGGYYGVDAFFVLSGYLITTLLVEEWRAAGTIALGRFWARRARRLLPALFVLVGVVGLVAWVWPRVLGTPMLLGDSLATLFYSSNWYLLAGHAGYFTAAAQPSPFLHTWSLAIEEQFYLVWPLVVLAVVAAGRRRRSLAVPGRAGALVVGLPGVADHRRRLERLFVLSAGGALASACWMAVLASGTDTDRAYYGTDARAQALLVGAALAAATARWGTARRRGVRRAAASAGVAGMAATATIWWLVPYDSSLAFHGGFLLASLAAAAVIAGVVHAPSGLPSRLLGAAPLRLLGRISYGVYLWYWPVLLVMTPARVPLPVWPLFGARVAVTVGLAAASYRFVERPVRQGAFGRWRGLVAVPAGAAVAMATVVAAAVAPMAWAAPGAAPSATGGPAAGGSPSVVGRSVVARLPGTGGGPAGGGTAPTVPPTVPAEVPPGPPVKVLLVGDSVAGSIGVGLGEVASRYGIQLVNEGSPGCSLAMDQQIRVLWYTMAPGPPCVPGDPAALLGQWRRWVAAYNPDVVVYLARGELFDQEHAGRWSNIGQPAFDRYVAGRFHAALSVLGSRGATVVLLSTPYYDSGTQPNGDPWPEDAPSRVVDDNAIMTAAVRAAAGRSLVSGMGWVGTAPVAGSRPPGGPSVGAPPPVDLFDFGTLMSPGGHFDAQVDGVPTRCGDGVHFTAAAGQWLAPMLLPELAALGRRHQQRQPGGSWPGPEPPTVPSWWDQLQCQ